jgi:hypothetical protein
MFDLPFGGVAGCGRDGDRCAGFPWHSISHRVDVTAGREDAQGDNVCGDVRWLPFEATTCDGV